MQGLLAFDKYEGLGNDFIVFDVVDEGGLPRTRIAALCDRHFGIGADGVLLVLPPREAGTDAQMVVVNADGSVPEMCGNGARCVALHIARKRGFRRDALHIGTAAGVRACVVEDADAEGTVAAVTVDMGAVRVCGDREVDLDGLKTAVTLADAGNPHAVIFGTFELGFIERVGPRLATHPDFPGGTNVEFARVAGDTISLAVWERGVGLTLACGTGACATVSVACAKGLAAYGVPVEVRLPGGSLHVSIAKDGRATMRGPAKHVFSGVVQV
jgi:diaminopimelate epimerase